MRSTVACLLGIVFGVALSEAPHAAPTDPDPAFGAVGVATIPGAARIRDAALFPDGGLAVVVEEPTGFNVVRLQPDGLPDAQFANVRAGDDYPTIASVAFLPDGRFLVHHHLSVHPICGHQLSRHHPSGLADTTFGVRGVWQRGGLRCSALSRVVADATGRAYLSTNSSNIFDLWAYVYRVNADGTQAEQVAMRGGQGQTPWYYGQVAMQADGRPLAIVSAGFSVARFSGTDLDRTFGTAGISTVPTPLAVSQAHDIAVPSDGSIVLAGVYGLPTPRRIAVARMTSEGQLDMTFAENGLALIDAANAGEVVQAVSVAMQPDGKILVGATVDKPTFSPASFPRIVIARLSADGKLDTTFAPGGAADILVERGTQLSVLRVRPDGRIVLGATVWTAFDYPDAPGTQARVLQLAGGDGPPAGAIRQRKAVEYFHDGYGHYFLTADPEETAMLDRSSTSGWVRTGHTMEVWDGTDPSLTAVCRFWSDQTWAPKSSHFYTPYDAECASVKRRPEWYFERNAFYVRLPEGPVGARTCPQGSQPLYRAYNNGMTGAPNHRYMTDPALLDQMIAQGWTMEGEAQTRVFACVPIQ